MSDELSEIVQAILRLSFVLQKHNYTLTQIGVEEPLGGLNLIMKREEIVFDPAYIRRGTQIHGVTFVSAPSNAQIPTPPQ